MNEAGGSRGPHTMQCKQRRKARCQTGREEPEEQSLQIEVNVTKTEIRNLRVLKGKKQEYPNYSLACIRIPMNK